MGGEDLVTFEHPERAVYLLGAEDAGLPDAVVRACHRHVALPSERYESYNVAAAGSIVMYDRMAKQQALKQQPQKEKQMPGRLPNEPPSPTDRAHDRAPMGGDVK